MTEKDLKSVMTQRQIDVQRNNLVQICRYTVKTLIDKASLTNVDDDCEELINFCAALEQALSYRLKAHKTWYGSGEPRTFWHYIQQACRNVPNNCVQSISTLENVRSPTAKGRAWIRCVLMEKRLSEYLSIALQRTNFTRQSYLEGSVMLSDDAAMLCGVFVGLNAIDFSFCLKGESLEFPSPVAINYMPYLKYRQSSESVHSDLVELNELNNQSKTSDMHSADSEGHGEDTWSEKFHALETKYKTVTEQKGYLEELVRMRENQVQEVHRQRLTMLNTLKQFENDSKQERQQLESVILELQQQLSTTKKQKEFFEQKYQGLIDRFQGGGVVMEEIQSVKQPKSGPHTVVSDTLSDQLSFSSNDGFVNISVPTTKPSAPSSKQPNTQQKHMDSQSMIAMAGSFTSQVSDQVTTSSTNQNLQTDLPTNENAPNTGAAVIDVSSYQVVDHMNNSVNVVEQTSSDISESKMDVANEIVQNQNSSNEDQGPQSGPENKETESDKVSEQSSSNTDENTASPEPNSEPDENSQGTSNSSFGEFTEEQIDESKDDSDKDEQKANTD